jgi:hypothetical protein
MEKAGEGLGAGKYHELSSDELSDGMEDVRPKDGAHGGAIPKTPKKKTSGTAFAMREMLHQIGTLSSAVQKLASESASIQRSQRSVEAEMAAVRAASSSGQVGSTPRPVVVQNPPERVLIPPAPVPVSQPIPQSPANDLLVPLLNGARISRKTHSSAISGEFVNLQIQSRLPLWSRF